ncbi:MAG: ArnT family glycosyltransferase [Minwuia sp.]|uniref:ArnT family glycosyltransferase n=1 Tax=Minwuia sp. TaxID=2493630 RepID=UPI003A83661F
MTPAAFIDRIGAWPAALRYGLLTVIALLLFLPGFTSIPPVDRDESRFAQATKQMVQSGDYVDIRMQDAPRHKKPAGIYWLQAVSVHVTGAVDAIWAYRIPSLIGAIAAVLLTAAIGGMLFHPGVGFGAGVIMASSVLLNVEARTAKTDAMLLAATLAALALMLRVIQDRRHGRANAWGFWAALGFGFLIKGPIPFLPVAGLGIAESWRRRSLGWLAALKPLTGVLVFIAVAAPWFIAITIVSDGGFFAESVGKDMVAKVASGQESHGAPPGLYLALATLTFWPFSLLGLIALPWIWRSRADGRVLLLLGWALLTWIVFALTPTKLAHYVLPAYPALAILAVAALNDVDPGGARWWRWIAFTLWGLVTLALAAAMPVLVIGLGQHLFDPWWFSGVILLPAIFAGARLALARRAAAWQLVAILLCAGIFSGIVFGRFLPGLTPVFVSPRIAEFLPERPGCERPFLASAGFSEPSLVFLTETRTELTGGAGAAQHLAAHPDCGVAAVEQRQLQAFLDRVAASGQKVLAVGAVEGFNYARGKRVLITLYIARPEP